MPDYEYAVQCPNGEVWDDWADGLRACEQYAADADSDECGCACKEHPHTVVRRSLVWEQVPADE